MYRVCISRIRPTDNRNSVGFVSKHARIAILTDQQQPPHPNGSETSENRALLHQKMNSAVQKDEDSGVADSELISFDPLYKQVYEWVKEDNAMTIARVQIRLRLGYGRARRMALLGRDSLRIDVKLLCEDVRKTLQTPDLSRNS